MEYLVKYLKLFGPLYCLYLSIIDCSLIDYIEESCYGSNGFIDSLQPICPTNQVIYPHDVYTYAKRKELGCPWTSDHNTRNETYCCRYVNETEDCGMKYYGNDNLEHYRKYTGVNTGLIPVAWNDTINVCNQSIYEDKTHYMRLSYNCINESQIGSVCNSTFSGNPLYLWNDGYPSSDGNCSITSGCTCLIQSTGGSTIQIDSLDIRFATNSDKTTCAQRLYLNDQGSESDIACDDVNLFERRKVFISSSSSVTLRYDNTLEGSAGNFWISVEATDRSQILTITCGEVDPGDVQYKCGENFTIISPLTTPSPTGMTETSSIGVTTKITTTGVTTNISTTGVTTKISTTGVTTKINTTGVSTSDSDLTSTISSAATQRDTTSKSTNYAFQSVTSTTVTHTGRSSDVSSLPTSVTDSTNTTSMVGSTPLVTSQTTTILSEKTTFKNTPKADASTADSSSSKGPVIGAVVGAVAAAAAGGLIAYSIWRRKMKASYQVNPEQEYDEYFGNNEEAITSRPPGLERMPTRFE